MDYQEEIVGFSTDFKIILLNIKDIENKREKIVENLSQLKTQYSELIKTNTKKIFLFCLDSFFYQYKIYSAELEQIESSRKMINNRMYCEYYKLYGIIVSYLSELKLSYDNKQPLLKLCPIYKDLEPFIEFDTVDVENIYNNVILLITHLHEHLTKNNMEIDNYKEEKNIGFSISNFVNTIKNDNLVLEGQIRLFMNYLAFFISSQKKQYARICYRMVNFSKEIEDNINKPTVDNKNCDEPYPSISEISEGLTEEIHREPMIQEKEPEPVELEEKKIDSPRIEMTFE
jgi:hypothetical protein